MLKDFRFITKTSQRNKALSDLLYEIPSISLECYRKMWWEICSSSKSQMICVLKKKPKYLMEDTKDILWDQRPEKLLCWRTLQLWQLSRGHCTAQVGLWWSWRCQSTLPASDPHAHPPTSSQDVSPTSSPISLQSRSMTPASVLQVIFLPACQALID